MWMPPINLKPYGGSCMVYGWANGSTGAPVRQSTMGWPMAVLNPRGRLTVTVASVLAKLNMATAAGPDSRRASKRKSAYWLGESSAKRMRSEAWPKAGHASIEPCSCRSSDALLPGQAALLHQRPSPPCSMAARYPPAMSTASKRRNFLGAVALNVEYRPPLEHWPTVTPPRLKQSTRNSPAALPQPLSGSTVMASHIPSLSHSAKHCSNDMMPLDSGAYVAPAPR
mmetsp:Transcript_112838/g.319136  ORF Transcript_112838/g.319136 Transcript_112838/m.319136 type:complete len:226 (-) Transcript_112838:1510-2187(-)